MHFDFALTCHAPIGPGLDEVGAYSYHLLNTLASAGRRCVVFTGTPPSPETLAGLPDSITVVHVVPPPVEAGPPSPMHEDALRYTHALHRHILAFLRTHSIRLIEFPDLDAEGYDFINHNLIHRSIPCAVVRLHSPRCLRDEDDARRTCPLHTALVYAAELEAIQSADHVFYHGNALLERVLGCFPTRISTALRTRCVLLPHPIPPSPPIPPATPSPAPRTRPALVCPGPLGHGAGTDRLVLLALAHFAQSASPRPRIVCLGPDTLTPEGKSFATYLDSLVPEALKNDFVFDTSASPSARQDWLRTADAFVLPARVALHPAALHDLITLQKPTFVSHQGAAPDLVRSYPWIQTFAPSDPTAWSAIFQSAPRPDQSSFGLRPPPSESLDSRYTGLSSAPVPISQPPARLALVIPHLDDIENLTGLLARFHAHPERDRLELIIVDDGSAPAAWDRLHAFETLYPAFALTILRTAQPRSGPFLARRLGTQAARSDFVAYVDSDDYIETDLYLAYAQALSRTPTLDIIIPWMRCFGLDTNLWLPLPKAPFTVFFTGFAHVGLVGRKPLLRQAFDHARPSIELIAHYEDCLFAVSLLFLGAKITTAPEVAYYYNRTSMLRRSQTNTSRIWHSQVARGAHFDRCMTEALALGTLTPLDLRIIRHLALHLPAHFFNTAPRSRGNRAPWHTHLYRALRSLCRDRRYAP